MARLSLGKPLFSTVTGLWVLLEGLGGPDRPWQVPSASSLSISDGCTWPWLCWPRVQDVDLGGQWEGSPHGVAGTALALADPAAPALLVVG